MYEFQDLTPISRHFRTNFKISGQRPGLRSNNLTAFSTVGKNTKRNLFVRIIFHFFIQFLRRPVDMSVVRRLCHRQHCRRRRRLASLLTADHSRRSRHDNLTTACGAFHRRLRTWQTCQRRKVNKKAQLTQRERATAVHV